MKSSFFYDGHHKKVSARIKDRIDSANDFLSEHTAGSPRAVGDAIERIVSDKFADLIGDWCKECSINFARRAMADVAFTDKDGFYCVVDVKTHRDDTKFNMPNLTSVERLARFYEDDKNIFALMLVSYSVEGSKVTVSDVTFAPIEFLDWDCLTLGALGWGQIQIANSNRVLLRDGYSRKSWMLSLCEEMLEFYPKEIVKINERVTRFEAVQKYWKQKEDLWT